jgi:cobalt-zinc-cadmium efflux system outer membrane protein
VPQVAEATLETAVGRPDEPRPYPIESVRCSAFDTAAGGRSDSRIEQTGLQQSLSSPLFADPAVAPPMPAAEPTPAAATPNVAPQPLAGDSGDVVVISSGFTLEQAEQLALANNPTQQAANAIVHKAIGTRTQIGKYPNPTIGYNADDIGDEGTAGSQGVFLQQTIVLGRKLELNEHVAEWEVQALNWQAAAQRQRVRNDVRTQFYIVLGAQNRFDQATRNLARVQADQAIAIQQYEALPRPKDALDQALFEADLRSSRLQTEVLANETELIRNNAQVELDAAWRQLAILMGCPDMPFTPLADILRVTAGPRDLAVAREQLLSLSPVLAQARAEVQRAGWRIQREKSQPIPNVQLQVIGAHSNTSGSEILSIQAGLPVPLFNKNEGNVMRACADYQRACWHVRQLESKLEHQLMDAYQQYKTAEQRAETYAVNILPQFAAADATSEMAGDSVFFRAINRRTEFEATLSAIQALVDLRTAEVALDGLLLSGAFDDLQDNDMDDTNRWNALSGQ